MTTQTEEKLHTTYDDETLPGDLRVMLPVIALNLMLQNPEGKKIQITKDDLERQLTDGMHRFTYDVTRSERGHIESITIGVAKVAKKEKNGKQ